LNFVWYMSKYSWTFCVTGRIKPDCPKLVVEKRELQNFHGDYATVW